MEAIKLPLAISGGRLTQIDDLKKSIDSNIGILLSTPCYSCAADPGFGFIFNNLRFEIFDENEGVVYNSDDESGTFEGITGVYDKKISGSSKNLNTFAAELKETVARYEPRIELQSVTMTYVREEKLIYIAITGNIAQTETPYNYTTTLRVWK